MHAHWNQGQIRLDKLRLMQESNDKTAYIINQVCGPGLRSVASVPSILLVKQILY